MTGIDFVEVRLTRFGAEFAEGGPVRVHEGAHEFNFTPGAVQRVTKAFDWNRVLSRQMINGHALFEIVPEEPAQVQPEIVEENL